MDIMICKNSNGFEIFNRGSKVTISYIDRPDLVDKTEEDILDMVANKTL